jgi:uncharacterized protein (DUF58 family)
MEQAPRPGIRISWIVAGVVLLALVGAGAYVFLTLRPQFEVSINYPSSLTVGQTGTLEVRVRNRGDKPGVYELSVGIGDNTWRENVWVGAGAENVLRYTFTASSLGMLEVLADGKVGKISVMPVPGGGESMWGTLTSPVNWESLDSSSGGVENKS